jgi:beta-glucosidase
MGHDMLISRSASGEPGENALTSVPDAPFPVDFVWGTATSAYQVEGAVHADGRSESIWDRFCRRPGAIADGTTGDDACGHYERWADDVALMAELDLPAYRFSIAWPRVVPHGRGVVNQRGLDFYDRLVDGLLAAGVEPYPTLYHWDLPQALEDRGGWPERSTAFAFAEYVEAVVGRLGDRVRHWTTLNEPHCSAHQGYVIGTMAPGRHSAADGFAAAHHLLLAHGLAVPRIRRAVPGASVGLVLNFEPAHPASAAEADVAAAALEHGRYNRWYIEPVAGLGYPADTMAALGWAGQEIHDGDLDLIAAPVDELGVNYYARQVVSADPDAPPPPLGPRTASGWEIYPDGLLELLRWLHASYRFPRYLVTENGAAMPDAPDGRGFVDDQDRIGYGRDHLVAVRHAIAEGVPVEGYFVWSLLDNFEWAFGYSHRFGLVRVDFDTLERVPKASARWFAEVARSGIL